jgi:hypothetical protein
MSRERTLTLAVRTASGTHSLASLLSVLHSRGAEVEELTWTTCPDNWDAHVVVRVRLEPIRHDHLRDALRRLVYVTAVDVAE